MGRKLFDRCIRCRRWTFFGLRKFYRCPNCNLPFCKGCVQGQLLGLRGYICPNCQHHFSAAELNECVDPHK